MGTSATFSTVVKGIETSFTYHGSYSLGFAISKIPTIATSSYQGSDGTVSLIHIDDLLEYGKQKGADPRIVQICEMIEPFSMSVYWYPSTILFPKAMGIHLGMVQVEYGE